MGLRAGSCWFAGLDLPSGAEGKLTSTSLKAPGVWKFFFIQAHLLRKEEKRKAKEGRKEGRQASYFNLTINSHCHLTHIPNSLLLNKEDRTSTCKSRMQLLAGFSSEREWSMISSGLSSPLNGHFILLHHTSAAPCQFKM